MKVRNELIRLRAEGKADREFAKKAAEEKRANDFQARCQEVTDKLDMRLRTAARIGYLELKLIPVDSSELVDLEKIGCLDSSRRSSLGGGSWRTVKPYQDKTVVRHPALLDLWMKLESKGLQPIFIEGPYGAPIFGVQLPDGGEYPRKDSAEEVAFRTMNRFDFYLNENGSFTLPAFGAGREV